MGREERFSRGHTWEVKSHIKIRYEPRKREERLVGRRDEHTE